jgi:hypothetical protein
MMAEDLVVAEGVAEVVVVVAVAMVMKVSGRVAQFPLAAQILCCMHVAVHPCQQHAVSGYRHLEERRKIYTLESFGLT